MGSLVKERVSSPENITANQRNDILLDSSKAMNPTSNIFTDCNQPELDWTRKRRCLEQTLHARNPSPPGPSVTRSSRPQSSKSPILEENDICLDKPEKSDTGDVDSQSPPKKKKKVKKSKKSDRREERAHKRLKKEKKKTKKMLKESKKSRPSVSLEDEELLTEKPRGAKLYTSCQGQTFPTPSQSKFAKTDFKSSNTGQKISDSTMDILREIDDLIRK